MKPEKGKKREKTAQSPKKEDASKGLVLISGLFFNIIGGLVAVMVIYVLFSSVQGYDHREIP